MNRRKREEKLENQIKLDEQKIWGLQRFPEWKCAFDFLINSGVSIPEIKNSTVLSLTESLEKRAGLVNQYTGTRKRFLRRVRGCIDVLTPTWRENPFYQKVVPKTPSKIKNTEDVSAFYQSFEWRKLRYFIIRQIGGRCMACNRSDLPLHCDHIKPVRKYWHLRLDPDNIQVLCEECNHGKGNWDETDWRTEEQKTKIKNFSGRRERYKTTPRVI